MPVVLPDEAHASWLDPALDDAAEVGAMIRERALSEFQHYSSKHGTKRIQERR
jgi:putative SOS response-associated peptidase YedK